MADDYVRETLRSLARRTGDSYVPLSEVLDAIQRRIDECMAESERSYEPLAEVSFRCEADRMRETLREIERRWGPGPRCERCGDSGHVGDGWCSCAAADARAKLVEERLPLTPEAIRERMEAARG